MAKFQKGQSGNPAGRPRGSRNKLSDEFLKEILSDFEAHGRDAIVKCREDKPDVYVRVIAGLLPKQLEIDDHRQIAQLSDKELEAIILSDLEAAGYVRVSGNSEEAASDGEAIH